jgi:uncharacterized membrane protein YqgA involved in biofilm formation
MDFTTGVITIVASNIMLIVVMVGTTIGMWLHTDKKIDAIQTEMKDFHRRMCKIEARKK